MRKNQKLIAILVLVAACVILAAVFIFGIPNIENRDWVLAYAQKTDPYYMVVAHGESYDFSNRQDPMYSASKPVELTLEANDGKLIITDKTNGKIYNGTYRSSTGIIGRLNIFDRNYTVEIEGVEGRANFSTQRTLFMSIDGYALTFEID